MSSTIKISKFCQFFEIAFVAQETTAKYCDRTYASRTYKQCKREEKRLPLRKVTAECDVDTSILSKTECSERFATSEIVPILSKTLEIDFKELQMLYLVEKIQAEYGNEKYFEDSLKEIQSAIEVIQSRLSNL